MTASIWDEKQRGRPLLIGHRGASEMATENTLLSLTVAMEIGADGVEVDIRLTKDNEIICFHDESLGRLAGRPERIAELTLTELRNLYPNVLKLDQGLELSRSMAFLLDVKATDIQSYNRIIGVIERRYATHRCIVTVRDNSVARTLVEKYPHIRQICMLRDCKGIDEFVSIAPPLAWIRISEPHLSNRSVDQVRKVGMSLAVVAGGLTLESVGKAEVGQIEDIYRWLPDAIILDNPALALKYFEGGKSD